jgi:hypothetical protein
MKLFSLLDIQYNEFISKVKGYLSKKLSEYNVQFGSNSVFGQIITIVGNAVHNIMLYIEDSLVEQNKYTAQRKKSIYGLASLSGYTPSFGKASIVSLKLSFTPTNNEVYNIILNNKEPLTCTQNGLVYNVILPQDLIVLNIKKDNTSKFLSAVQGRFETQKFISSGGQYYTIHFKFNGNLDTDYISVKVNDEKWDYAVSLYDMDSDQKQYTWKAALDGGIDVIFGNEAHGRPLAANDVVEITYLVHDGELGNLNPELETFFTFNNQLNDIDGSSHDGNGLFNVTFSDDDPITSGSNSETLQHVRHMIGLNSRSLVLASPQNYKTFISRFGFVGYNRTWTDAGSMIVNSLIIKNYKSAINSGIDYFSLEECDFILSSAQKKSINDCIEKTGNQLAGVKYNIFDPELCKYAMYIYVSLKDNKKDKEFIKNSIRKVIGEFFTNIESDSFIPKSDIIQVLKNEIDNIDGVDIYILSQKNEAALITQQYVKETLIYNNNTGQYFVKKENVRLMGNENPNLGLDSHGNIWLKSDAQFPILMGGWDYKNDDGELVHIDDPLIITFEE